MYRRHVSTPGVATKKRGIKVAKNNRGNDANPTLMADKHGSQLLSGVGVQVRVELAHYFEKVLLFVGLANITVLRDLTPNYGKIVCFQTRSKVNPRLNSIPPVRYRLCYESSRKDV